MRLAIFLLIILGGLALALLPLSAAALLVAGAVVVVSALVRPQVSLYLLIFAVPFASLRPVPLGGLTLTAIEALVALLAAGWLARAVLLRRARLGHAPLVLPLLLYLAAQILSLFDALSLTLALGEIAKWAEVLVVYIIAGSVFQEAADAGARESAEPQENSRRKVTAAAPITSESETPVDFTRRPRAQDPASPRRQTVASSTLTTVLLFMLAAALAEALLGVYQAVLRVGPEWFVVGRFLRAYGTFDQPNPFAGYLNHALPLGYALLLAVISQRRSHRQAWQVLALAAWLAVVGLASVLSFSRGAWLGLAAAAVVITLLHSRRTAGFALVGSLLAAAVLFLGSVNLLPAAVSQRFSTITDDVRIFDARAVEVTDANFAVVERMAHWQAAWDMFYARPWLGWGAGNYPAAYPQFRLAGWKEDLGHAHNVFLNVAAEMGLVGLAAYLIFLVCALLVCWQAARSAPAPLARAIALGVLGVLVAKITHEMLDNLWVHGMGAQIGMLLAMVTASTGIRACQNERQPL